MKPKMTYPERCALIDELGIDDMQNHPANENRDVLTICGMLDREGIIRHAGNLREGIARFEARANAPR